jgi:TMEM175 potassium channel family protein
MSRTDDHSERGLDRLVNFSDAVTAIAISLLILPLVDKLSSADNAGETARQVFSDNSSALVAFGLSFAVIALLWTINHQVMEDVDDYSPALVVAMLVWLVTIVFMPVPTELLGVRGSDDAWVRAVYIGSVLATSVALLVVERVIDRTPSVWRDGRRPLRTLRSELVAPLLIAVALVVGVTIPVIGMWAMVLVALTEPVARRFRIKPT